MGKLSLDLDDLHRSVSKQLSKAMKAESKKKKFSFKDGEYEHDVPPQLHDKWMSLGKHSSSSSSSSDSSSSD